MIVLKYTKFEQWGLGSPSKLPGHNEI